MHVLAMSRCIPPSCDWSSCRTDLPICLSTCLSLRLPRSWKLLDELVWAVARMAWNGWQCPYLNSVKLSGIWIHGWILLHRDMRSDDSFRPFLRLDPCCKSPCSLVSMAIGIMIPDAPCAKRLSELPFNFVVFTLNFISHIRWTRQSDQEKILNTYSVSGRRQQDRDQANRNSTYGLGYPDSQLGKHQMWPKKKKKKRKRHCETQKNDQSLWDDIHHCQSPSPWRQALLTSPSRWRINQRQAPWIRLQCWYVCLIFQKSQEQSLFDLYTKHNSPTRNRAAEAEDRHRSTVAVKLPYSGTAHVHTAHWLWFSFRSAIRGRRARALFPWSAFR